MKNMRLIVAAGLSVLLAGCYSFSYTKVDSVFPSKGPKTQSLTVVTTPNGASCNVTSYQNSTSKNTQYIAATPDTVTVNQGQSLIIDCTKSGYQNVQQAVQPAKNGSFPSSVTINMTVAAN